MICNVYRDTLSHSLKYVCFYGGNETLYVACISVHKGTYILKVQSSCVRCVLPLEVMHLEMV